MILQALTEYYNRKSAEPDRGIAPVGWIYKTFDYMFIINLNGDLNSVEPLKVKGKKPK